MKDWEMEYFELLEKMKRLLESNMYIVDNEIKLKNKIKYDLYNLLEDVDPIYVYGLTQKER